jgi:hypothetical protein
LGVEQGQSDITKLVVFLDENHCRNRHVIEAIEEQGIVCEKHLDHFAPGSEDTDWLPVIAQRGWSLLTTDARIRTNFLEKEAVRASGVRMFYFYRNNLAGNEMGIAIRRALPQMQHLVLTQAPPFTASINKKGEVHYVTPSRTNVMKVSLRDWTPIAVSAGGWWYPVCSVAATTIAS